jgi:hypothetical protein
MSHRSARRTLEMAGRTAMRRAGAAERMRRNRERRREGLHCYMLEIRDQEIEALIRRGFLRPERRNENEAIVEALYEFLDGALV